MKLHVHKHTGKTKDRMHIHKRMCAVAKKQKTGLGDKRQSEELILGFLVSEIQIIH